MSWGVWVMRDVTNTYVAQGLTGGLLTLIVLLLVLIFAFGNVGRALNARSIARSLKRQWICWCIGVAICVHAVTFLGVSLLRANDRDVVPGAVTGVMRLRLREAGLSEAKGEEPRSRGSKAEGRDRRRNLAIEHSVNLARDVAFDGASNLARVCTRLLREWPAELASDLVHPR